MMVLRVGQGSPTGKDNVQSLATDGIRCEHCESGREALERLRLFDYDLVLIDLELPDMPGHETIRLARTNGRATPCIVLAAAAAGVRMKVKALDHGADDFVTTPCDPGEVLARMRAVVRRGKVPLTKVLRFGPVELNVDRHEVTVRGKKLAISRLEFRMLELLFLKQGSVVHNNVFLKQLYAEMDSPDAKTIDVMVCRLRKKLADAGVPELIGTVWGHGYMLKEPRGIAGPGNVVPFAILERAA
jgi:two-component system cell cycle response regulator CtrA